MDDLGRGPSAPAKDQDGDWVYLTILPRVPDAQRLLSTLLAAGVKALVPDAEEMEAAGTDFNANLIEQGMVWIYVRLKDFPAAKQLLPEPETKSEEAQSDSSAAGDKRVIASMEASQTGPILERLKTAGIPVEVRTAADEGGVEISELLVEDSYYDRGCDLVEAWSDEEQAGSNKRKPICPECGSENCHSTPHIRLGSVTQCKDCGFEFLG